MTDKPKVTPVSELGEFGLIDYLTKNIRLVNKSSLKGVGDDAAVMDYGEKKVLLSTDLLIEGVHFDMVYMPLKHLGYKAAVVNFSDIIAMNGVPRQMTVSIAISNRYSVEALEEIYAGILLACEKYKVDLVGGDTTSSLTGLMISITVVGDAEENRIVYRNTARENDLICVSGDLGSAYLGMLVLEREKQVFKADPSMQPELTGHEYVLQRQLKPEARLDIINLLHTSEILPTAMIDISDGLASEILHICTKSDVGAAIYQNKIPVNVMTKNLAAEFKIEPYTCALNGGEDYELLFTIKQADYEKIKELKNISVIGHITDKSSGVNLITPQEQSIPITAQGWDGLRKDIKDETS